MKRGQKSKKVYMYICTHLHSVETGCMKKKKRKKRKKAGEAESYMHMHIHLSEKADLSFLRRRTSRT
jgi:hypothetical protein